MFASLQANAQFDLLRTPKSPAATLMNFSPSEIHTPTNPNDLMLNIKNQTNDFKIIPKSFSIEIAPARLFGKKSEGEKESNDFKNGKANLRDAIFSIAYRDSTDIDLSTKVKLGRPQIGFGFDIPLFRHRLNNYSKQSFEMINSQLLSFKTFAMNETDRKSNNENNLMLSESMKANQTTLIRKGFAVNASGGFVTDYREKAKKIKYGLWLTPSYEFTREVQDKKDTVKPNALTVLGLVRILKNVNPENIKESKNVQNFDFGGKLNFTKNGIKHINVSAEYIYRYSKNFDKSFNETLATLNKESHRFAFNTEFQFRENMMLTFAIGRDFDGNFNKGGNVFSLINFVAALGSDRTK